MFPVDVSCPRCGSSLLDPTHPMEGFASIHVKGKHLAKEGDIWLSSIYGSFKGHQEVNVPRGTEVDILCPKCNELLSEGPACLACDAKTVILEMLNGGMVRFCARFGCRKHSIAFGDLGKVVIASIMNRYIVSVYKSDPLITAVETLVNYEISAVPVIDDREAFIGLLTENRILELSYPKEFGSDSILPIFKKYKDWHKIPCGDVAITDPLTVAPDTSLVEAGNLMIKHNAGLILVMKDGTLVGILSKSDLFRALLREKIG